MRIPNLIEFIDLVLNYKIIEDLQLILYLEVFFWFPLLIGLTLIYFKFLQFPDLDYLKL